MTMERIIKRDGRTVPFDVTKIENAIVKSFEDCNNTESRETAAQLAQLVVKELEENEALKDAPTVEDVQDTVERVLIEKGFGPLCQGVYFVSRRAQPRPGNEHSTDENLRGYYLQGCAGFGH